MGAAYGSGQNSTMLIASPPSSRHRTTPINTAQWQGSVENRSASGDDCPPCRAVANVYIERFRPGVVGSNCGSVICFERNSYCWHAICTLASDPPVRPFLPLKELNMLKIELYNDDDNIGDPPASFATDAEIEIAEQLRYQLEERYLGPSAPYSPLPVPSRKDD